MIRYTKEYLKEVIEKKEVNIKLPSEALGDNLAWMPYIEEFRRRKKVKINDIVARAELFVE